MPQDISITEFARRFRHRVLEHEQPITWFFGAGCSISSGIQAATGLTRRWVKELHELQGSSSSIEDWATEQFDGYSHENAAFHYANVFARRHPAPADRQREIEQICSGKQPGYGYATFAEILSHDKAGPLCNTVLTTNFDDLIADALYLFGDRDKRPQVITHEALARYIRVRSRRPTVVKLHGDAMFDPQNLSEETHQIESNLASSLYPILQDSAIVFVGYGGNDKSICKFLDEFSQRGLSQPVFWIGTSNPCDEMNTWLSQQSAALRVELDDFDRLMHILRGELQIGLVTQDSWLKTHTAYMKSFEKFEAENSSGADADTKAAMVRGSEVAMSSLDSEWAYILQANKLEKTDPEKADQLYKKGAEQFPDAASLLGYYAVFLKNVRKEFDRAEEFYKRALEAEPDHANNLGNYAVFLKNTGEDMDRAEEFYKRALDAEPEHATNLGNYALFLNEVRKDFDRAEEFYKRALEAEPDHANNLGNYALFLNEVRKDFDRAEEFYKRALEAEPENVNPLGNYANFLCDVRKDMDRSEEFHKRALEAEPENRIILGNYAVFLNDVRKDFDRAEEFYKRALNAEPDHANILGNYSKLLLGLGRKAEAESMFRKSKSIAAPLDEKELIAELNMYQFIHLPDEASEALSALKQLIEEDVRTDGWDYSLNAARAETDGCPNIQLMNALISVLSEGADPATLDDFEEWRKA